MVPKVYALSRSYLDLKGYYRPPPPIFYAQTVFWGLQAVNPTLVSMRNCLTWLCVHVKLLKRKWLCLCFDSERCNSIKNSLILIRCLWGLEVTHQTAVRDVPVWFPAMASTFIFVFVVVFLIFCQKIVHVMIFCNSFSNASILNILYICDELYGYQDTDLASLILNGIRINPLHDLPWC